jgi:hypothetical protein
MRAAHEAAKGRYDRLDDTHRQVARDQFPGRYDELKAATPAPEIARQFETSARRAGETAAPIWDRDADNAAWDAKIADSGKDAPEARQQPGDRAGSDMRAEAGSAAGGQQHRPEAEDTRPLGKTAGEIRTAWSLTRAGGDLEEALASRGIALAKVTGDEARASERAAAFAKEVGNFGRALKEGETVAVNQYGDVHRIDARTTGDLRPEIEGRLAGLDLLSVTDAKEAMREAARASLASEAREWRDMNTPPTGIETTIADALENTMTGTAFAAALDDAGLTITRATESDVTALGALRHDESLARLAAETNGEARRDHHFARLEPGDFAAVTRAGDVFRLNPTALDFEEAQQRLADTQTGLPCVVEARAVNEIAREETAQLAAQWRADNTAAGIAWSDAKETQHEMREPLQAGRDALGTATAETVEIGFDVAGGVAKGMTKLIDMLGGFFDFLIGEAKLSPQQIELAERAAAERAEAKADIFAEQSKIAAADALNFRQDRQQAEDKLMIEVYGYVPGRPPDPNTDRAADREDDYDRERERERY